MAGATRNLAVGPSVLTTDDRAPSSLGGGGEKYAERQNARLRHPRATAMLLIDAAWTERPRTKPMRGPQGFFLVFDRV
ncbi:hypothetical protein GCM10023220_22440 [Streptomyces ziwulingensis]|uniref:Transposase n=1 Tax=Streptomyces ziwulingensis TaxID=1045501 RepID=A0ABP9BGY6_9ACTN